MLRMSQPSRINAAARRYFSFNGQPSYATPKAWLQRFNKTAPLQCFQRFNERESLPLASDIRLLASEELITQHKGPMGIQEVIVEEIKKEAAQKSLEAEKLRVILKGYAQGLPVELLSKLTDWPEEKVKGIITENTSSQPE